MTIDDKDPRLIAAVRATRAGENTPLWQIAGGAGPGSGAARRELLALAIEAGRDATDEAGWTSGAQSALSRELEDLDRRGRAALAADPGLRTLPGHPVKNAKPGSYDCHCGGCLALPARAESDRASIRELSAARRRIDDDDETMEAVGIDPRTLRLVGDDDEFIIGGDGIPYGPFPRGEGSS